MEYKSNLRPMTKPTLQQANDTFNVSSLNKQLQEAMVSDKIEHIKFDLLDPNPKNVYDTSSVDNLKISISLLGVQQNLVVYKLDSGKYRILTGGRRYEAVKQLNEENEEKIETLPCLVCDLNKIKLNMTIQEKEEYLIRATNETQRNKSEFEKMTEIISQIEFYKKLKEKQNLQGRLVELVSKELEVSSSQVQRYEKIYKNLISEFMNLFRNNKINFVVAVELSKATSDQQKNLYLRFRENVTVKDIKNFINPPKPKKEKEKVIKIEYSLIADFIENEENAIDEIIEALKLCKECKE